jgi:hypothetical protein
VSVISKLALGGRVVERERQQAPIRKPDPPRFALLVARRLFNDYSHGLLKDNQRTDADALQAAV